jgi:hypothetical protein
MAFYKGDWSLRNAWLFSDVRRSPRRRLASAEAHGKDEDLTPLRTPSHRGHLGATRKLFSSDLTFGMVIGCMTASS